MTTDFGHLRTLPRVLEIDLDYIQTKDRSYGASWKRRGGVGAFMMLARKWDRLEQMLSRRSEGQYDIFGAIGEQAGPEQGSDGTVLAEVRDLRRYLALVEAEMVSRGAAGQMAKRPQPSPSQGSLDLRGERWFAVGDQVHVQGLTRIGTVTVVGDDCCQVVMGHGPDAVQGWFPADRLTHARDARLTPERSAAGRAAEVPTAEPTGPGTPEDGGHHARQGDEEPEEVPLPSEVRREPVVLTNKEWEDLRRQTISHGSQEGRLWGELYEYSRDPTVIGRPRMYTEHQEEYGR